MILDAAGGLVLDCGAGEAISLKEAGTRYGVITNSGIGWGTTSPDSRIHTVTTTGAYAAHFESTINTPYGVWIEENHTPSNVSANYPLLTVTNQDGGSTYFRVNSGGITETGYDFRIGPAAANTRALTMFDTGGSYYMKYKSVGTRAFAFAGASSGSAWKTTFKNEGSGGHDVNVEGNLKANYFAFRKGGADIGAYFSLTNQAGDSSSNDLTITAGQSTNSVVLRSAAEIQMYTYSSGWQKRFDINNAGECSIQAGKAFYLDGGSNTYIYENSADSIGFVAGGANRAFVFNSGS